MPASTAADRDLRLALGRMQAGDLAGARVLLESANAVAPFHPYVLFNLAVVCWQQHEPDLAIRLYRQTLAAKPDFFPAVVNLGDALIELGVHAEALRYTAMATRMQPGNSGVWRNHSRALTVLEQYEAGLAAAEQAIRLAPRDIEAHRILLSCLGRLKRGEDAARRALDLLALDPEDGIALLAMITQDMRTGDWSRLDGLIPRLLAPARRGRVDQSLLGMAYVLDDPAAIYASACALDRLTSAVRPPRPPIRVRDGRLRIGYVSPDFRDHPVAYMLAGVLEAHDRTRVEVMAVPLRQPDGSRISSRLMAAVDGIVDVIHMDDRQAASAIREAGIDVLVDVAGETDGCRRGLLNWRSAPVQVLWLGCPITTGNPSYDGFIVDGFAVPEGMDVCFSEPLVRIPGCFHPITTGLEAPPPPLPRSAFGLPETGLVLAALHQIGKITPASFRRWCRIAAAVPDAVLMLADHKPGARATMAEMARAEGLEPTRLHFAAFERDRVRHIARWQCADLVLDGYPYGGHSTVGEALTQGVPVLTCAGATLHARVGASMLASLGLDGLVATSVEAYESLGKDLVVRRDQLVEWRRRTVEAVRSSDPHALTRRLEAAYHQLAGAWTCQSTGRT